MNKYVVIKLCAPNVLHVDHTMLAGGVKVRKFDHRKMDKME